MTPSNLTLKCGRDKVGWEAQLVIPTLVCVFYFFFIIGWGFFGLVCFVKIHFNK